MTTRKDSDMLAEQIGTILAAWQNQQDNDALRVTAPAMALAALLGCQIWLAGKHIDRDFAETLCNAALREVKRAIEMCNQGDIEVEDDERTPQ